MISKSGNPTYVLYFDQGMELNLKEPVLELEPLKCLELFTGTEILV